MKVLNRCDMMALELQLSDRLHGCSQDFLLYAIVLCDGSQHAAVPGATESSDATGSSTAAAAMPSVDGPEARPDAPGKAAPQRVAGGGSQPASAPKLTAAEAWAALQLYTASTGKYAAGGSAFMAPVYGVGELPQARCLQRAAGPRDFMITSLSQRDRLMCGEQVGTQQRLLRCMCQVGTGRSTQPICSASQGITADAAQPHQILSTTVLQAFCRVAAVAGATYVLRHPVAALLTDRVTGACVGVSTAAGQTLRCAALAADCASLTEMQHRHVEGGQDVGGQSGSDVDFEPQGVARAVCIVDASLQVSPMPVFPTSLMYCPGRGLDSSFALLQAVPGTNPAPSTAVLLDKINDTPSLC